jgi:predicted RNA-binding Zn-ribbon protein involved in translation (DUF1610 family)
MTEARMEKGQSSTATEPVETTPTHMPVRFRKCPNCGTRFEMERTAESVEKKEDLVPEEKTVLPVAGVAGSYPVHVVDPAAMTENVTVDEVVEEDVYTERYRCKHCGHVWTERFEKVRHVGAIQGAGPDL